jgi:hypothetical protein
MVEKPLAEIRRTIGSVSAKLLPQQNVNVTPRRSGSRLSEYYEELDRLCVGHRIDIDGLPGCRCVKGDHLTAFR